MVIYEVNWNAQMIVINSWLILLLIIFMVEHATHLWKEIWQKKKDGIIWQLQHKIVMELYGIGHTTFFFYSKQNEMVFQFWLHIVHLQCFRWSFFISMVKNISIFNSRQYHLFDRCQEDNCAWFSLCSATFTELFCSVCASYRNSLAYSIKCHGFVSHLNEVNLPSSRAVLQNA